jgi:hypothetical protein
MIRWGIRGFGRFGRFAAELRSCSAQLEERTPSSEVSDVQGFT